MIGQIVHNWIHNKGSFVEGVNLLIQLKQDTSFFKPHLQASYIKPSIRKLLEAKLQPFAEEFKSTIAFPAATAAAEPNAIIQLREEVKDLFRERQLAHENMRHASSDDERFKFAKIIIEDLTPRIEGIYERINHYENTGTIKDWSKEEFKKEIIELAHEQDNLRSRISRINGMLKKTNLTPERRSKLEKELLIKKTRLEKVDKELEI